MLVSPGANRQKMLKGRSFDQSGKLGGWYLDDCKISKLPPSFGALVCSGGLGLYGCNCGGNLHLQLGDNKLESVPNTVKQLLGDKCCWESCLVWQPAADRSPREVPKRERTSLALR
jgi:hypothetical protein